MNYSEIIYQRWIDCCEDALLCCNTYLITEAEEDGWDIIEQQITVKANFLLFFFK